MGSKKQFFLKVYHPIHNAMHQFDPRLRQMKKCYRRWETNIFNKVVKMWKLYKVISPKEVKFLAKNISLEKRQKRLDTYILGLVIMKRFRNVTRFRSMLWSISTTRTEVKKTYLGLRPIMLSLLSTKKAQEKIYLPWMLAKKKYFTSWQVMETQKDLSD